MKIRSSVTLRAALLGFDRLPRDEVPAGEGIIGCRTHQGIAAHSRYYPSGIPAGVRPQENS